MKGFKRRLASGSWQLRIPTGSRGSYRYRTVPAMPSDEADLELARFLMEAGRGDLVAIDGLTTFTLALEAWLHHVRPAVAETTHAEYERVARNHLIPALGGLRLERVTTFDLDRLYRQLLDGGLSPARVEKVHLVAARALAQAVKWEWIARNPTRDASPPARQRPDVRPPSLDEARALLVAADAYDPAYGAALRVLVATGMRRGELCGLQWPEVRDEQLGAGELMIRRAVAIGKRRLVVKDTKTHAARTIAVDGFTIAVLRAHRLRVAERALVCGAHLEPAGFVFSRDEVGLIPWRPDGITARFDKVRAAAGVTGVRLHDLRHFQATMLLADGVDVRTVAGRMGHANPAVTLQVYAHFMPAKDREAADRLAALLR